MVMYNFEMERLINAARSTGFAECAFEDAARYAKSNVSLLVSPLVITR